jgi:hypothetical protein
VPSHLCRGRAFARSLIYLLTITIVIPLTAHAPTAPAQAQAEAGPLIESSTAGLTLTWQPPAYRLTRVTVNGIVYSRPDIDGLAPGGPPGAPQLPVYSGLIGLPPTGAAELRILDVQTEQVQLPHPPLPVPRTRPVAVGTTALPKSAPTEHTPDAEVYATDAYYPGTVAELGEPAWARDRRVAGLTIYPLRVNPVTRALEVVRSVTLEIRFSAPARSAELGGQASGDAFGQALSGVLLNPEAGDWTSMAPRRELAATVAAAATAGQIKIMVGAPGLYAVTFSALQAAGVPVSSIDPSTYVLQHGYPRQEVAIRVESDRLRFYAAPAFSRFTDQDAYFLSWGGAAGLRMATRTGDPTGLPEGIARRTVIAEENHYYDSLFAGRDGDHWFWDKLQRPDRTAVSHPIRLVAPRTDTPARLTVWLQGYTNPKPQPNHRVRVTVNQTPVGEVTWTGRQAVTATFNVPSSALRGGDNTVGLSLPGVSGVTVEGTWLDAMGMVYATRQITGHVTFDGEAGRKRYSLSLGAAHRLYLPLVARSGVSGAAPPTFAAGPEPELAVYDITHPQQPQWVTGYHVTSTTLTIGDANTTPATYLVVPAGETRAPLALLPVKQVVIPPQGADYIIVTHPDFSAAIARLANHRAQHGLRVTTVDVQAVYDTFGAGRPDPQAIRSFLAHAYAGWTPPAPLYVLLVGDGSYDPKDHSGFHAPNFMPPYLADVDLGLRETASDNRLVTLTGQDNIPDMLIGRLSVTSAAETATAVDKIIAYETNEPGLWFRRQLIVADNPDPAGSFHAAGDQVYNYAGGPFRPQRLYYGTQASRPYIYTDAGALKNALLSNYGAGLVTYFGHSSWLQWAVEDIFQVDDISRLANRRQLPVVLQMTCYTGFFHHPRQPTLDESLVRYAKGGAVAAWGSSGLASFQGHITLHRGFYTAVRAGHGGTALGSGALGGKLAVWATGWHLDLLDTFTLFGDPAMTVRFNDIPDLARVYLPVTHKQ